MEYPIWDGQSGMSKTWLASEQERLEVEAIDLGIERYRKAISTDPTLRTPEQRMVARTMPRIVQAIEEYQDAKVAQSKKRRLTEYDTAILAMRADKTALVTLQVMVRLATQNTLTSVYDAVGGAYRQEIQYEALRQRAKEHYTREVMYTKNWTPHKIDLVSKKAGVKIVRWSKENRIRIGFILVNLVLKNSDIFHVARFVRDYKTHQLLQLTDETADQISRMHENMEILSPVLMPMVIPPRQWDRHLKGGGYIYQTGDAVLTNEYDHRETQDCPLVQEAVNYCQSVPWRVNDRVLDVASHLWKMGGGRAGLVASGKPDIPPRPEGDWNSEAVMDWRQTASRIHTAHARASSNRVHTTFMLDFARKLRKYPCFWFVHQLCFRGRLYTSSTALQPQGNDLSRGLLLFGEAKEPDERGMRRLKIHLANCFGVDKVPFDERVRWADTFLEGRNASQFDPYDDRRWMEADEPFGALAAVYAVLEPQSIGSRLPVSVDGTCNGIQHLSALGLDEVGAAETNLLPRDRPADLYRAVLNRVNALIEDDCLKIPFDPKAPHPCWAWRGNTTRTVTKQPVMTISYGVTKVGMRGQIISNGCCNGLNGKPYQLAAYMQTKIDIAIGEVIVAAQAIMGWLRKVAKLCAEAGHAVRWTTPLGFVVNQSYTRRVYRQIRISRQRIKLLVPDSKARISGHLQARGLAPNFVHSMDAAHMQAVAIRCREEGITFSATHDSFKTHAIHVDRLGELLREEFVTMYSEDRLEMFRKEVMELTGVDLPPCPKKGSLDISRVIESEYFFS